MKWTVKGSGRIFKREGGRGGGTREVRREDNLKMEGRELER